MTLPQPWPEVLKMLERFAGARQQSLVEAKA
jgi:hypothetical protein